MLKLNHKNLDVWKLSIKFVSLIYSLTKDFPKEEMFGLTNQLRRASVSIVSNIAEGSSRKSSIERKRCYEIARSSLVEVDTQIEISKNLNLINEIGYVELDRFTNEIFAKLSNLILKTK